MNSNVVLGLVCACALAAPGAGAQPAPAAAPPATTAAPPAVAASGAPLLIEDSRERNEPNVRVTVIEDQGSRIEQTNVRGQPQRIVVTPKVGTTKSYEIIPDGSGRPMYDGSGASRGAVGKRVWNIFDF